ncbi:LysE family transporter [Gorillibacterium sp. sgz5001074]|uniref:LysE family transporter n=1 Tax=Gorillibacterium sp. sgz5001074 TaxID=3446695 RepID=UPI003F6650AD
MNAYISYILLGLTLAAPIGPINAAQLDKGIKYGFLHSWLVGLGAMIADAVFMLLIYFGSAQFLDMPFLKTFLWLFGCFVLTYTGIESMSSANDLLSGGRGAAKSESYSKSFSSGFLMTLSNPVSILFWLGIYGSILATAAQSHGTWELLIYSSGIFVGIMCWDFAMAVMASAFNRFLSRGVLLWISRLAGLSMIGFGVYFGLQAARELFG